MLQLLIYKYSSYLTGRCQRIKLDECMSSKADLRFGVPQGAVLGPLLFTLYTTPLSSMICEHAIPHHIYTDDSQLYVSFASGDSAVAQNDLQSWRSTNKLKLNPDKTEFLLIGNQRSKYLSMFPIELLGVKTNPAKYAWNLGVMYDKNFTFHSHNQQPEAHAFTICGICGVFTITLIWMMQNYLQLLSYPVVSIIAFHFCMALLTLTPQGFRVYWIN